MDEAAPPELDEAVIQQALVDHWGVAADEAGYVPKGAGSYHWLALLGGRPGCFVTVDDLETKPWISDLRDEAFDGLSVAFTASWSLEHDAGISFAVGPLRNLEESVIVRLSDQYSLSAFPFVAGRPGVWGEPIDAASREELVTKLAGLHSAELPGLDLQRRPYSLPERPILVDALAALDRPWDGGPLAESARQALIAAASEVRAWLEELDDLAAYLTEASSSLVVTHGEPHPGNLIHTSEGMRLIDWDTVAFARPERDLWMLECGTDSGTRSGPGHAAEGCFRLYEELTGHVVSRAAVSFYRLAWTLGDIASIVEVLRSPHGASDWMSSRFAAFEHLLAGTRSAPYGAG